MAHRVVTGLRQASVTGACAGDAMRLKHRVTPRIGTCPSLRQALPDGQACPGGNTGWRARHDGSKA